MSSRNRQVFPRSMVAHLWANKSQDSAREPSGNFFFTGPRLFSYGTHFVVAAHTDDAYNRNGRAVVLVNSRSYSNTTSKHQSEARSAARHFDCIYVDGMDDNDTRHIDRDGMHAITETLFGQIRTAADAAANPRIRPSTRASHYAHIRTLRDDALHLAGVDASKARGLSAERRKAARAMVAQLVPLVVPADEADKAAAADYAFAINRSVYVDQARQCAASAARLVDRAIGSADAKSWGACASYVHDAGTAIKKAREWAAKARTPAPRGLVALEKKIGGEWRATVNAGWKADKIEAAHATWERNAPIARAALADSDFGVVSRCIRDHLGDASCELSGETGADERAAFMAEMQAAIAAWADKSTLDRAAEQMKAAREHYDAGRFERARDIASSAGYALRHCGDDTAQPLADEAYTLSKSANDRMPEEWAARLQEWRDGVPGVRVPSAMQSRDALLRVSADGRRIETSHGADVPVRICAPLWELVKAQRIGGGTRHFNGSFALGHFSLDTIDGSGNIVAGCHNIPFAELQGIAARLGLAPCAGAQS